VLASAAAATGSGGETVRFERVRDPDPLRLLRSYDIPADDPAYDRLLNLSWTYDSAIGAVAFAVAGERKQAEQLLDQLQALQRTDGSIDFAYHTLTGAGAELERSGTVAWVGLAAALYEDVYNSSRYKAVAEGAAQWLLARQVRDSRSRAYGLVVGGPDVTWVSTQHNLVTWFLLRSLRDEGSRSTREARAAAAELIAQGVDRALLVRPASGPAYVVQGVDDAVRPLDVQTLGILHLLARGRAADALRVAESVRTDFAVSGRSIALSSDPTSYNRTYSASGPFSGFRP
jgi:hypothetical protein